MRREFHTFGVAALCLFFPCQWTAYADDDVNSDSYRSHPDGDGEPALASLTPEEKSKCIRELKRVERRSRKLGIFLNRAKMERMKGNRLALVLASYDRFISILEEMPADFVKACRINSVWFSDEIVDMDGNHAGGIATGEGINLPLKFRKGTVYHEMFHKFECCISSSDNKEWLDCNPDHTEKEGWENEEDCFSVGGACNRCRYDTRAIMW